MQNKDQIKKIAHLACIDINDDATDRVTDSIDRILSLMDQLQSIDTDGVQPMAHPLAVEQRLRADTITESDQREQLQAIAPTVEDGLFLVPKVID